MDSNGSNNGNNMNGLDNGCMESNGNNNVLDNDGNNTNGCMDNNGNNTNGFDNNGFMDPTGSNNNGLDNNGCMDSNGNNNGLDNDGCMDRNGNNTNGLDNGCMDPNGNYNFLDNDIPMKSWDRSTLKKKWNEACETIERDFGSWLKQRYLAKNGKSTFRVDTMLDSLTDMEAQAAPHYFRDGDATCLGIPVYIARLPQVCSEDELALKAPKEKRRKKTCKKIRDKNFAAVTKIN